MMRAMGSEWLTPFPSPAFFIAVTGGALAQSSGGIAPGSSSGNSASAQTIALWAAAMIGAIVLGAVVLFVLRRKLLGSDDSDSGDLLSLHDLRQMHARGDLSDEEFDVAKAALLGLASRRDALNATPGFDLTGEPLPGRAASPRIEDQGQAPKG